MASDTPSDRSSRLVGVLLVMASTAFFALAGIFTKSTTADAWTIACWRGLVGAVVITLYVLVRRDRSAPREAFRLGWRGWALVVVGAISSIFFIASFKYTYVANVAVIYATVPFMAAAIDWLALGVKARRQTIATATISLVGVLVIVGGSLGGDHLLGDGLALLMTFGCAIYLVMVRAFRDTPAVWAAAVSALLVFFAGWAFTDPLAISAGDLKVVALFGVSFATAVVLWTEGARLLPASEAGLLGATEVPMAILFAWLILSEAPPWQSFIGGAIVLAAVFAHAGLDVLNQRQASGKAAAEPSTP